MQHENSKGEDVRKQVEVVAERKVNALIGENLAFGHDNAINTVTALIIDDGVPNRGHREIIFRK